MKHTLGPRSTPPRSPASTTPSPMSPALARRTVLLAAASVAGCAAPMTRTSGRAEPPTVTNGSFLMADGARLPFRSWLPDRADPLAAILALHGMNDSRDAWEIPAPDFVRAGFAVYAPDQRGFGAAPGRGDWPGAPVLLSDAAAMASEVRRRHPASKLVIMGESMGGAVAMALAVSPLAPPVTSYVLIAPAVWGRARMNILLRSSLWLAVNVAPGMILTGAPVRVTASSNHAALVRLGRDPLTIHGTKVETLRGLVDLMDLALASAPSFTAPGLFLYGGKDELVPPEATAATWRALPPGGAAREAFYAEGYHLLLRDLDRAKVIGDVVSWIREPLAPLPSGADRAASAWLAKRDEAGLSPRELSRYASPLGTRSSAG